MELQHIVIHGHRLLLAAQAHEERPIYTALKSYDIHDLDSPLPPPLTSNLYVWLKWETLFFLLQYQSSLENSDICPLVFLAHLHWCWTHLVVVFYYFCSLCLCRCLLSTNVQTKFLYQQLEHFLKQQKVLISSTTNSSSICPKLMPCKNMRPRKRSGTQ